MADLCSRNRSNNGRVALRHDDDDVDAVLLQAFLPVSLIRRYRASHAPTGSDEGRIDGH